MGIADKVPANVRIAVVGLTLPVIVLYALALLGCVAASPGIPGLYLFLLQVDEITLKVGYFAVCAVNAASNAGAEASGNSTSSDEDICVATLGSDAEELSTKLFGGAGSDVVPVLDLALTLQGDILIPLILVAVIFVLFGAVLFTLTKVTQMKLKNPSSWEGAMKQGKMLKPATLAVIWLGVLFGFGAAVGSTMGIGSLNFIIPVLATNISVTGGQMVQALQFLGFFVSALFGLAATILLGDPLEKQQQEGGMRGEGDFNPDEKDPGYDESMQGGVEPLPEEMPEGMDPEEWAQLQQQQQEQMMQQQEGYGAEGEYPGGQEGYPEGQEGYPEGQEGYPDGQQGYPEGQEGYDDQAYDQQQQQQPQQPPYPS